MDGRMHDGWIGGWMMMGDGCMDEGWGYGWGLVWGWIGGVGWWEGELFSKLWETVTGTYFMNWGKCHHRAEGPRRKSGIVR